VGYLIITSLINCPQNVPVKEFGKSVNIGEDMGNEKVGSFLRHSVDNILPG